MQDVVRCRASIFGHVIRLQMQVYQPALSAGCGQLQSINLTQCVQVTDAGVSALSAGSGKLQSINLTDSFLLTDAGVSALDAGCSQLQSINLLRCHQVTDAGVSLLRSRNGFLQCFH